MDLNVIFPSSYFYLLTIYSFHVITAYWQCYPFLKKRGLWFVYCHAIFYLCHVSWNFSLHFRCIVFTRKLNLISNFMLWWSTREKRFGVYLYFYLIAFFSPLSKRPSHFFFFSKTILNRNTVQVNFSNSKVFVHSYRSW